MRRCVVQTAVSIGEHSLEWCHSLFAFSNELRTATMKILKSALQPRASNIQVHWDVKASKADGSEVPVEITVVPQENPPIFDGCFTSIYGLFKSGKYFFCLVLDVSVVLNVEPFFCWLD